MRFIETHPQSHALFERTRQTLLGGVPMNWMVKWAGAFPVFVREAHGAHFTCADGHEYVDLCLGDTGAMTGHSPEAAVEAIGRQAARHHADAPDGRQRVGGRGTDAPIRPSILAVRVDGDRREPVCACAFFGLMSISRR